MADLFDMQDEIVARLANQLQVELVGAEARRAERAANPDAMDLYFQGMAWLNKALNSEDYLQARVFFERALALDPGNIDALAADLLAAAVVLVDGRPGARSASSSGAPRLS